MLKPSLEARREWRVGWPAVCAGLFGAAAAQIHFASVGIFIKPISDSMGWNTSTVTFGVFISAMVAVPGAPLAGWLAQMAPMLDHFGSYRTVMLVVFFTLLLCALLFVTLGAYPTTETSDGSSDLEELDGTEDREPAAAPGTT
jgi:hypothetical protein